MFLPNKYSNAAIEYSNKQIIKFEYSNYSNNFNNTNFYFLFWQSKIPDQKRSGSKISKL
jgi:hypothetical protein